MIRHFTKEVTAMHHAFIINPASGKRKHIRAAMEAIDAVCARHDLPHTVTLTECAGDAVRIARGVVERGEPARIYAVGGDGTLCEVVQAAAGAEYISVTNLPAGTGNDFLKLFGSTYKEAFWDLETLVTAPETAALDVMDCNGRLGLDVICAGVDARVAADVDRFKALPLVKGQGAYIMALAQNVLFKGIARPMRVEVDGAVWDKPTSVLCICNGRHYGGGFMPVGDAMPDDGILDTLLIPKVSLPTFAKLVGEYAKGRYADYPELIEAHHTPGPITFTADEPITTVVDGEVMRDKSFTVKLSDKKLNFFWPAGVSYQVEKELAAAAL